MPESGWLEIRKMRTNLFTAHSLEMSIQMITGHGTAQLI